MKRTFISLFLIVLLIIAMTACSTKSVAIDTSQTGGSVKNNSNITNSSTNTSKDKKTNTPAIENQSEQEETFYGKWSIKKQIAYGPVSTYSNDEIKKMLGKTLSYSKEKAAYETNICENPVYKKSTISQADFETRNKVKFSNLGITNNTIVQTIVYTDGTYKNIWNEPGSAFYIKDQNTLILLDGGVYFELTRETS
jgi:hypothetical protein